MEREFESKGLLSEADFKQLLENLEIVEIKNQVNTYIDTAADYFKRQNSALRLRIINDQYIFSLKRQDNDGATEWNTPITKDEYNTIIETKSIDLSGYPCPQNDTLTNLQIVLIETQRHVCNYNQSQIELDITTFNKAIDYELEIEADSLDQASAIMQQLAFEYHLDIKKSYPKIARYFIYN